MCHTSLAERGGTVTVHTTMQYGHSAPITYKLWTMSQCTNTTPAVTPICRPSQNQRRNEAPANRAAPTAATMAKEAMPSRGLGKPNSSACGVLITDPHDSTGLRLQLGT